MQKCWYLNFCFTLLEKYIPTSKYHKHDPPYLDSYTLCAEKLHEYQKSNTDNCNKTYYLKGLHTFQPPYNK
jgi:hypothetical protein